MGVGTNFTEAVKWYRRAAEQGHAKAQNWLGWCYKNGKGVKVDLAESAKWYRKAAEQGIVEAKCEVKRVEKRLKSGSSLRARRLQRQREAGAAGEKQCEEQSTKKSERQAQAEREKRQLEAEKEGRRQRLLTIQEELKKVREAKARAAEGAKK